MRNFTRILSLALVFVLVMCYFAIPVAAASTGKQKIVKWSAVSPSVAKTNTISYTIKGNWLSEKKVTVKLGSTSSSTFNYDSNAINFYKNNACFRVDIYKGNTWQRAYTGTLGQYFKLPKGSTNYTVIVQTYYTGWKSNSTCWNAANGGTYYLKY